MRVLLVAALAAAVVFASPVYAAVHAKKPFFSEEQCSFYKKKLLSFHESLLQADKNWNKAIEKVDLIKANQISKSEDRLLKKLAEFASVYSAVCKP